MWHQGKENELEIITSLFQTPSHLTSRVDQSLVHAGGGRTNKVLDASRFGFFFLFSYFFFFSLLSNTVANSSFAVGQRVT